MAILLIDSPYQSVEMPDVRTVKSQWYPGSTESVLSLEPAVDVIVFFDCGSRTPVQAAHLADGRRIREWVGKGGVFIAFVAEDGGYRVGNLIAAKTHVQVLADHVGQPKNFSPADGPFFEWFSNHALQFNSVPAVSLPEELRPEALATHNVTGQPVAQMARVGMGIVVILPVLSGDDAPVAQVVDVARGLVESSPEHWLNAPEFWLPPLRMLKDKEAMIRGRFEAELEVVASEQQDVLKELQHPAERLLTVGSGELVAAAIWALSRLGITALDVDAFKQPPKEEDLWVAAGPLEADLAPQEATHLAEVKGYKRATCRDDDLGTLVRYLHRRGREWKRTDVRGLMIVNHTFGLPPGGRPSAFSATQIGDADRDDVGLLSTVVLFELLQQFFAGQVSEDEAQALLLGKSGIITL